MKPTQDFETAQAFTGESEKLPIGGHVCMIRNARCELSKSGKEMLVLAFDISEGSESDGYYQRRFKRARNGNPDAKWQGVYRSTTTRDDGSTNPMFKGLITAIEESNAGYKWNWNEVSLHGKYVGFNFGEEEYVNQMGEIRTSVKPRFPASVNRVLEGLTPPERKAVDTSNAAFPAAPAPAQTGFANVDDPGKLPF